MAEQTDELVKEIGDRLAATARAAVTGHLRSEAAHAIVRAVLTEIAAAGKVVVPREPTPLMDASGLTDGMSEGDAWRELITTRT